MMTSDHAIETGSTGRRVVHVALAAAFASVLALGAGTVAAQDATPEASPADSGTMGLLAQIFDVDGNPIGSATFTPTDDGAVSISVRVNGVEPGEHGLHIHETGICDPGGDTPFESAGGHFNPTNAEHGPGPQDMMATPAAGTASPAASTSSHAGDLGNITVGDDGTGMVMLTTDWVTLDPDATNSLADADGSALIIHAGEDDLVSQPSGDSGDRLGCAIIVPAADATPVASS